MKKIDHRVYLVTDDPSRYSGNWLDSVIAAVEGGVTCVQYRDTESDEAARYDRAVALRDALRARKIPLIINNDARLAAAIAAEGVHVGQSDMPPVEVRKIVGPDCEIGLSITDIAQLSSDRMREADCLGVGPVHDARKTKSDASEAMGVAGLRAVCEHAKLPVVAIGGITLENAQQIVLAGAEGLAVVSAFSRSADPKAAAKAFRKLFDMRPCCLTVAGSDSGGNAGVQADLRAFHAYGLHGCTVFAALTAQNPFGVSAICPVAADFVAAQLDAVLGIYGIRAMKTGMLGDPESIEVIADRLAGHHEISKVVDPVMVATSGARLVSDDARAAIVKNLLPLATLITPNLPEAEVLCGGELSPSSQRAGDASHARDLAVRIHGKYGCAVLVKGGHGSGSSAVDVLYDGREIREFTLPWVNDPVSTHGTGCTLAASLAAELALGRDIVTAVAGAKRHVRDAIAGSYLVGENCGVLGFADMD